MPPLEAAQEGTLGGWRHYQATASAGRPAGAQHVGVVNAVAAGKGGGHLGHQCVAGVGLATNIAQVEVLLGQMGQAEAPSQGGQKDQSSIGQRAVVVKRDTDRVGVVAWQYPMEAACLELGSYFKTTIPDTEAYRFSLLGDLSHANVQWMRGKSSG